MNTVALGLSGGVDSCASALLLKEKGYKVIALYFDVLKEGNAKARNRAEKAAMELGLDFVYKNVSDIFEQLVINPFCIAYEKGMTPSPCVMCNPSVKFKILSDLGTDFIATGHYARIVENNGIYFVRQAENINKDQSYMLSRLPQEILSKLILPLGEISSKEETRSIAKKIDAEISSVKDSQDICFINDDYRDFLASRGICGRKGDFVTSEGINKGPHRGTAYYTLGQRKGLGVALGSPAFVSDINTDNGNVILTTNEEDLFRSVVTASDLVIQKEPDETKTYLGKLRYSAKKAQCRVKIKGNSMIMYFDEPQRAPTKGQAAVIYDRELIIASGIITNTL